MSPTEDQEPEDTGVTPVSFTKGRQSLSRVRRELSEDELSTPAVQRLLVEDIERLERERTELREVQVKYHEMDKRAAILEAQLRKALGGEIVFGVCLAVGAAALGYAPAVWNSQPSGWLSIIFGTVLITAGVASRVVQR